MIELMNWKMCKSSFLIIYLQYFKAYFRNAAKDAKKEMNENKLKFCLNALIQLLDEWGGNFFSWEKIFDDEEDDDEEDDEDNNNIEIDFGKYIKDEDSIEIMRKMLNNLDLRALKIFVEYDFSIFSSILADDDSDDAKELISNPVYEKFSKSGLNDFSSEDATCFLQLLDHPNYAKKIIENLTIITIEQLKSALQCIKNLDKFKKKNTSTAIEMSKIFLAFYKNDCLNFEMEGFNIEEANHVDIGVKQAEKKYVFNTIFEIIKTEGREKIFKYTFSEAVKIILSSAIILIKKTF